MTNANEGEDDAPALRISAEQCLTATRLHWGAHSDAAMRMRVAPSEWICSSHNRFGGKASRRATAGGEGGPGTPDLESGHDAGSRSRAGNSGARVLAWDPFVCPCPARTHARGEGGGCTLSHCERASTRKGGPASPRFASSQKPRHRSQKENTTRRCIKGMQRNNDTMARASGRRCGAAARS